MTPPLNQLADSCAARLPASPRSFEEDRPAMDPELTALLAALQAENARYLFDAQGRPGALAAIRNALPAMEGDLLDAVLEDVACELAAWQEALYRVAQAAKPPGQPPRP